MIMRTSSGLNHVITVICATAIFAGTADGRSAKDVFERVSGGIVVVIAMDGRGRQTAQGSGVVVGRNDVATNCHVVAGAKEIAVRQAEDARGRKTYRMKARLTAQDKKRDVCLLFVEELAEPPAATPVPLGDTANAISRRSATFRI